MARNEYMGSSSCYYIREGAYVPGRGVNLQTGVSILALILRDYKRGYGYDKDKKCGIIRMDYDLFARRARYLYPLCVKHTGGVECEQLRAVIDYALQYKRINPLFAHLVRLAGPNAPKIMRELVYLGVLPMKVPVRVRHRAR